MKLKLLMILALSTTSALAHMDPKDSASLEPIPSSRACFEEMERIGCGHPREDREYFVNCYRSNERSLSLTCRELLSKLYGN